ncbi:hypothetical protein HK102_008518, partial [Quaeritorhiza haematococci]
RNRGAPARKSAAAALSKSLTLAPVRHGKWIVKPWGNFFLDSSKRALNDGTGKAPVAADCRSTGLGVLGQLNDEFLADFLGRYVVGLDRLSHVHATIEKLRRQQTRNGDSTEHPHGLDSSVLMDLLLPARSLARLARCSKALYAFCYHDPMWREMVFAVYGGEFGGFGGSWRATFKETAVRLWNEALRSRGGLGDGKGKDGEKGEKGAKCEKKGLIEYVPDVPVHIDNMYSDHLFASLHCAAVPLDALCGVERDEKGEMVMTPVIDGPISEPTVASSSSSAAVPKTTTSAFAPIPRHSNLSYGDFVAHYASRNKPVIITDVVNKWDAYKKWTLDSLAERCANAVCKAEAVEIRFGEYVKYARRCHGKFHAEAVREAVAALPQAEQKQKEGLNSNNEATTRQTSEDNNEEGNEKKEEVSLLTAGDESPLYLFDKNFARNCPDLAEEYEVPIYFREDLFALLGDEGRPDYRWLIVGPERSGSTFHVDPNSTSAWNAVITGEKKWILFPPSIIPPGVYPSEDGSEVTSPQSLVEWFIHYYREAKAAKKGSTTHRGEGEEEEELGPVEGVCKAGEVLFVPNGWWHCVMNLSESIAITQNYVDVHNLANVLRFLRDKPDQVSGFNGRPSPSTISSSTTTTKTNTTTTTDDIDDEDPSCHLSRTLYTRFLTALREKRPNVLEEMERREREAGRVWR